MKIKRSQVNINIEQDPNSNGYGDTNTPGLVVGDSLETALDKITTVVDGLAPSEPITSIGSTSLIPNTLNPITSARFANTGSGHVSGAANGSNISVLNLSLFNSNDANGNQPILTITDNFYNAKDGTLSFSVDDSDATNIDTGSLVLNSGTTAPVSNGGLTIASIVDAYDGSGFDGFFFLIDTVTAQSQVVLGDSTAVSYTYTVSHTAPSSEAVTYSFLVDSFGTIGITPDAAPLSSGSTYNVRYISGVPTPSTGDTIGIDADVTGVVSNFYNPVRFLSITNPQSVITDDDTSIDFSSIPTANATVSIAYADYERTLAASGYTENITLEVEAFDLEDTGTGVTTFQVATGSFRYDSSIDEDSKRVKSGIGDYPAIGISTDNCGDVYDTIATIGTGGNGTAGYYDELQYLNGKFLLPNASYTGNTPTAGPDYSGLNGTTTDSGNSFRWATFKKTMSGTDTDPTSIRLEISDSNSGTWTLGDGTPYTDDLRILIKVRNSADNADLTSWIDGNEFMFPPVDTATFDSGGTDGVAGLVPSYSLLSHTDREVYLGGLRSGDVIIYVRVGIDTTSSVGYEFGNVTITKKS